MKKRLLSAIIILAAAALALGFPPPTASQDRFFDTAAPEHNGVRLVVFHPTANRVKDVAALRAEKLIDLADLTVIGVYRQGENFDIEAAKALVRDKHLDWFKFHEVPASLGAGEAFESGVFRPEVERILKASDGMIFTGGPDIPPARYGSPTSLLTIIEDPVRHDFELAVLYQLLGGFQDEKFVPLLASRPGYPILAICLGAQSLNVATGGTLIQDIWNEVYGKMFIEDILPLGLPNWHNNPYVKLYPTSDLPAGTLQPIAPAENSKFVRELGLAPGAQPYVLSSHHQAMARLGKNLRVEAASLDGKIVEALSHDRFPNVLAVQFHPENMNLWDASRPYLLSPQESPQTWKGFLEAHPPSLEFHRKLWAWFTARLVTSH